MKAFYRAATIVTIALVLGWNNTLYATENISQPHLIEQQKKLGGTLDSPAINNLELFERDLYRISKNPSLSSRSLLQSWFF
jgi:hypothetical protein